MAKLCTVFLIFIVLGSILLTSCASERKPTEGESTLLWRLEETYINAHVEADHQIILSLWK
jgi:hypothetical protein